MRLPFRWWRGELSSGVYLFNLLITANSVVQVLIDELVYQAKVQWINQGEATTEKIAMREEDVRGIGKIAGVPWPLVYSENSNGCIKFSTSHIVNGAERSERGLWNMLQERFDYYRVDADNYPTGIIDEARANARMTFVPDGMAPVGYIWYGAELYNEDGSVNASAIQAVPPTDGTPYSEYYGERFLVFEEKFLSVQSLPIDIYMLYYECLMRISVNGASMYELFNLTRIIGRGYIHNLEIVQSGYYYTLYYSIDMASTIDNKAGTLSTWRAAVSASYKEAALVERT